MLCMKKSGLLCVLAACLVAFCAGCGKDTPAASAPEATATATKTATATVGTAANGILFIEAEDPLHLDFGAFTVGDKFTTYEKTADGEEIGVTVWVHKENAKTPYIGYFTNAKEMASLKVDSSACALDEAGCFTKAGVFTVTLDYMGFETTYDIRVNDAKEE